MDGHWTEIIVSDSDAGERLVSVPQECEQYERNQDRVKGRMPKCSQRSFSESDWRQSNSDRRKNGGRLLQRKRQICRKRRVGDAVNVVGIGVEKTLQAVAAQHRNFFSSKVPSSRTI